MDPTFILAPASGSGAGTSAPLNLLPFSLGPGSSPYTSTTAPISQYFQPRPCPPGIPGVPAGAAFAAFRGRQLVGQEIAVPRGYRGIVLSASARPEMGYEHREGATAAGPSSAGNASSSRTRAGRMPLTPASSVGAGSGTGEARAAPDEVEGVRRSPRKSGMATRGAGQFALSKPRVRQAPRRQEARKRIRLDSDDEDEDTAREATPASSPPPPAVTPRRGRSSMLASAETPVRTPIPVIQVQGPTPRKEPTATPKRSLRKGDRTADFVPPGVVPEEDETGAEAGDAVAVHEEAVAPVTAMETDEDGQQEVQTDPGAEGLDEKVPPALFRSESSAIIPSPATENDPPTFDTEPEPKSQSGPTQAEPLEAVAKREEEPESHTEAYDGPVRVLRPTSSFSSFMLWTADAPLAGFRADEQAGEEDSKPAQGDTADRMDVKADDAAACGEELEGQIKLRGGWWRQGGGGEGGDEMVRALGEWLGLVETIHKPLYLDDEADSDEDE